MSILVLSFIFVETMTRSCTCWRRLFFHFL